jgi:hypothetical protein
MKRLFVQKCQNSDVKKVNWSPARPHLVMQVLVSLLNMLAPPRNAPLAVSSVSGLGLEKYVNVFGRDALLAEKPSNDSLVGIHPSKAKL